MTGTQIRTLRSDDPVRGDILLPTDRWQTTEQGWEIVEVPVIDGDIKLVQTLGRNSSTENVPMRAFRGWVSNNNLILYTPGGDRDPKEGMAVVTLRVEGNLYVTLAWYLERITKPEGRVDLFRYYKGKKVRREVLMPDFQDWLKQAHCSVFVPKWWILEERA